MAKKILVVDNVPNIIELVKDFLEATDYIMKPFSLKEPLELVNRYIQPVYGKIKIL